MPAELVWDQKSFVATAELRFIGRMMPDPQFATAPPRKLRILQQRWVLIGTMWGVDLDATNSKWSDVPLVEEGS